jgi:hypothetical protein
MGGAPIRAAVVIAAIVAGALVISLGFPSTGGTITGNHPISPTTGTPSATPTTPATHTPPSSKPSGQIQGVVLAVYNTTTVVGLAACAATELSNLGYVVPAANLRNAPPGSSTPESEVFFRNAQGKADATLLAHRYFKDKDVKVSHLRSGADVPAGAELVIFLGTQYAGTHQGGC